MRENRQHGSEGGEAKAFPTPITTLENLILNNNCIFEHGVSQCCMYAPKILELLDFFSLYMTHSDTYNYPAIRVLPVPSDA